MGANGIYGLSGSGIDVESLVKVGMMSRQKQYDKLYQEQVKNTWKKEAYADLYGQISTFSLSTMSNYQMSNTTNPTVASSSNTNVMTATANSAAARMSHDVTVDKLASNAYMITANNHTVTRANTAAASTSIALKDIAFTDGNMPTGVNGDDVALSFEIQTKDGGPKTTISFTYAEVFTGNKTLNDLASKINNAKDSNGDSLGLKASYDANNETFAIHNGTAGKKNIIELSVVAGGATETQSTTLLTNLHLGTAGTNGMVDDTLTFSGGAIKTTGKDLEVVIDGRKYTGDSNNLSVDNVNYTFKEVGKSTVSISQDTDKLKETVKKFVEDYNKMIDKLNDLYNTRGSGDYKPLTTSQRETMKDEQIEKWETKAKEGLLYRDSHIRDMIGDMRNAIINPVESADGKYNTLMSLGITSTGSQGHLVIDEKKLDKAIAEDPEAVYKVLSSSSDNDNYGDNGVATRIHDSFINRMKTLKAHAGSTTEVDDGSSLGKLIGNFRQKMSDFKAVMEAFETQLYKRYDAMEVAISQLSAQFNYYVANK